MKGEKKGTGTEEYLRAFWEQLEAIRDGWSVIVEFSYHPTERKGVFCWHMAVLSPLDVITGMGPFVQLKAEWPNSQSADLGGFLFSQSVKLDSMVGEALRQRERATKVR